MNILLFDESDILEHEREAVSIRITGERFQHISQVQDFSIGDTLRIGLINGKQGFGEIESLNESSLTISGTLYKPSHKPAPCKLVLAMPRPIMLKRILVDVAMLGIKDVVLLKSHHVQKSYWSSKVFADNGIDKLLLKGLEQSCDTLLPRVTLAKKFKPFVEDELKNFSLFGAEQSDIILAHPNSEEICPQPAQGNFTLIVGPENGFTPYEVELLNANGAISYTLGTRHLRVETAVTYLLGRLL